MSRRAMNILMMALLSAGMVATIPVAWALTTGAIAHAQSSENVPDERAQRFVTFDLYIETASAPLAAWQVEIRDRTGAATIVGLEGGSAGAFNEPPTYDPAALTTGRIIVASFSTDSAEQLPTGRIRVATLHVHVRGNAAPEFDVELTAVATVDGRPLRASVSLAPHNTTDDNDTVKEDD